MGRHHRQSLLLLGLWWSSGVGGKLCQQTRWRRVCSPLLEMLMQMAFLVCYSWNPWQIWSLWVSLAFLSTGCHHLPCLSEQSSGNSSMGKSFVKLLLKLFSWGRWKQHLPPLPKVPKMDKPSYNFTKLHPGEKNEFITLSERWVRGSRLEQLCGRRLEAVSTQLDDDFHMAT